MTNVLEYFREYYLFSVDDAVPHKVASELYHRAIQLKGILDEWKLNAKISAETCNEYKTDIEQLQREILHIVYNARSTPPESIGGIDTHRSVRFSHEELDRLAALGGE